MCQPAKLSSLLDIYDELQRDICQLMFLHETIPFLLTQDIDQEIISGISYTLLLCAGFTDYT